MENNSNCPFRVGHGYDLHRLQAGGQLVLGSVIVSREMSPVAHSDGDVVLHAIVDALMGAAGLGDIGEAFPNSDPRWKGAASSIFVQTILERLRGQRFHVVNCDIMILAERPRISPFKKEIAASVAQLLGCAVNIKAGTNEGCDSIGRGEAIAAHAIVLISRSDAR